MLSDSLIISIRLILAYVASIVASIAQSALTHKGVFEPLLSFCDSVVGEVWSRERHLMKERISTGILTAH